MTQLPNGTLELSNEEFIQKTRAYTQALEENQLAGRKFALHCGSLEKAREFTNVNGVGISKLAQLANLPVTTLRHYQRLGLVTPYKVNGKFRFGPQHLVQAESVKQWRDLGMSLEEIVQRRQRSGFQVLLRFDPELGPRVVFVKDLNDGERTQIKEANPSVAPSFGISQKQAEHAGLAGALQARQQLQQDYQDLLIFLQNRKAEIEAQLEQITRLQTALESAPRKPKSKQQHQ